MVPRHSTLLLGLIENHGAAPVASALAAILAREDCQGDVLEMFERSWNRQMELHPTDAGVAANAGIFLLESRTDPEGKTRGSMLLGRAMAWRSDEWRWASLLLGYHANTLFMATEGSDAARRAGIEALRSLRVIEQNMPKGEGLLVRLPQGDLLRAGAYAALAVDDMVEARRYAEGALEALRDRAPDWDTGNVLHEMHIV